MFNSIKNDLIQQFRYGGMTTRLVLINIGLFVGILFLRLLMFILHGGEVPGIFYTITDGLSLASSWKLVLFRPWTIITHMFLHLSFFHLLINMLYLFWFGRVLENLLGERKILNTYLLSGLAGAIFFFLFSGVFYDGVVFALGASAAVMGIAVAAATMTPDHEFHLLFIGRVKLKFIVLFLVILDFLMIPAMSNSGGHIAHIGGAVMGFIYIKLLYQGVDLGDINFKPRMNRPKFEVYVNEEKKTSRKPQRSQHIQDQIDEILDKIRISGYDSLTQEEKDFLYEVSKK